LLVHDDRVLQMLGRTMTGRVFESWSRDAGHSWETLRLTNLPNCNSGIDAVSLRQPCRGVRHVLVYNHSNLEKVRYPLNVAISADGATWLAAAELEAEPPGQYSYPCVIESQTGLLHVAYTWKRRTIRHAVIDPSRLEPRPLDEAFTCPPPGSPTHRADEFQ
jgi:alpha-L-rhamnosidase